VKDSFYCRTCKRALNRYVSPSGSTYLHAEGQTDHESDPILLEDLPDAIMICDFCSADHPTWYYDVVEEAVYVKRGESPRVVSHDEVRTGRYAGRVRDVSSREARRWGTAGAEEVAEHYGERWSACDGCAAFIDVNDLWGLVGRVVAAMPAKATKGKKLIPLRGQIAGLYERFLATVKTKQAIKGE